MGLRYGLLAALTLVLASALVWDRMNPPRENRLQERAAPAPEDTAVLVFGGTPRLLAPPPPPASLPGGPAEGGPGAGGPGADGPVAEDVYTVEKGDTLGGIALKTMGSSRKAADLARANGFPVTAPLRVGQEIRIPPAKPAVPSPGGAAAARAGAPAVHPPPPAGPSPPEARLHTVGKGDSLFALAERYYGSGAHYRRIAEANGLDPEAPLRLGRDLRIP
jgi:nucleoid-associated protein YgaU